MMSHSHSSLRSNRLCTIGIALAATFMTLMLGPPCALAEEEDGAWPREIEAEGGTIVVYQPQLESFEGNKLSSRAAVSVQRKGESDLVFGAIWLVATVQVDRDERMVYVEQIQIPRVRFPDSTPEQEAELGSLLEKELPATDLSISLDRVIAGLEAIEREREFAGDLSTAPPGILIRTTPSMLILIDGEPELGSIPDTGLMRVMNTAYLIAFDSSVKTYYLYAGPDAWYTSRQIKGDWSSKSKVPDSIAALAPDESAEEEPEVDEEDAPKDDRPPAIVIATKPTELVNIDGDPVFTPVADDDLMYVSNADGDLIREVSSQDYYLLLSGRWYRSASFDGPWDYVASDALPAAFAKISPESDVANVRAFVAGTEEAQDAVLDAQIPETAVVSRSEATLEVEYDGKPELEAIEGTSLQYVTNASESVLKAGTRYYACSEGVWYVADDPSGPWAVSTVRPTEVDAIPPSSPVYNVKYVYIYDSTPEVVYVGYTAGYAGGYIYGPTIVYGTGYWYRPWWRHVYYPRPLTFGFRVNWTPWTGWSFGFGFRRLSFGIGIGFWSPWRAAWWGPVGFRGYRVGYRRGFYRGYHRGFHHGARAGARAGYRAGARAGYRHGSAYGSKKGVKPANRQQAANRAGTQDRAGTRDKAGTRDSAATRDKAGTRDSAATRDKAGTRDQGGAGDRAGRDRAGGSAQAATSGGRKNDVYADKNGNVHQRGSDGKWNDVTGKNRASGGSDKGSATRDRSSSSRQSSASAQSRSGSGQLERDHQARQRGSRQTQSYQRQRSSSSYGSGGSRSGGSRSGGGRRGGGGRR